jgi:hypothetical protein
VRSRQMRLARACAALCALLALTLSACASSATATRGAGSATTPPIAGNIQPGGADGVILAVLENIQANGFNADPSLNGGLGGLYINWRYGTQPLQTDFNGSGETDDTSGASPRHDKLTDLRYLHVLLLYRHLHAGDTRFDSEIARYIAIVKAEFAGARDERGWLYDEFVDLYRLSGDAFFQETARGLADYYATSLYHLDSGAVYKVSSDQPNGYYRVDLALEVGAALAQAGTTFARPDWVADGKRVIAFVYAHAYVSAYHAFMEQMSDVLAPDGSPNAVETIERGLYGHTHIEGGGVRMGEVAQIILSLLHAYMTTHDRTYLDDATGLIDPLTARDNTLGLWDSANQGYFAAAVFPGTDVAHAGTPKAQTKVKESGRQLQMLEVFRVANLLTNNRYQDMQNALEQVAERRAYFAPGHGYLYQMTSDWQVMTLKNGQPQDWVTTEAMGIALEGLLSAQDPAPW